MIDQARVGQGSQFESPPSPFRQTDLRRYELKRGGGMIAVLGLPFFLAGIAMALSAAGLFSSDGQSGGRGLLTISGVMGLVFLVVGGVMVFGRQWLVLDLDRGLILRQVGLIVPVRMEERRMGEFNSVVLAHNPGDAESAEFFPVKLRASMGKDIAIVRPGKFGESRMVAEFLAGVLRLPLTDMTSDAETTIRPEHVSESLRDHLKREGMPEQPARPATMKCKLEESGAALKIVIPGGGPGPVGYLGLFLPLGLCLFAILYEMTIAPPHANLLVYFVVISIVFGVPTAFGGIRFLMASKRKETTVTASATELVIVAPQGRTPKVTAIPTAELLDLDCRTLDSAAASVRRGAGETAAQAAREESILAGLRRFVPNPGIIIKSRTGLITIGEGLTADELRYVVWMLRKAVTG